ncbi:MAG: hypothetical protein WD342_15915 [Verrucomicrobiales bacterium]
MEQTFLGFDVQTRRKTAWMALNSGLHMIEAGWLEGDEHQEIGASAARVAMNLQKEHASTIIAGIDAPRSPLPSPREFYWSGKRDKWRPRRTSEVGNGRHCEVIVKAAGIANPQWTPIAGHCPEWMELGFALFQALEANGITTHEVFPSASYQMLEGAHHAPIRLNFSAFRPGAKDMIDACVAAYTVLEFDQGRGCEIGDDGLGSIVLPRPLPDTVSPELFRYPRSGSE